jgi:RHS repeat-associated protein
MVQVANQNQPLASYAYDFDGQRVAKTTSSAITQFLYDRAGHLLAENNGATGAAQTEYLWLDDMPLALVTGGTLYFIHPDHLGTPQKATDAAQNLAWDAVLRPFGQTEQQTFPSLTNLRFPGQYFDVEDGLNQNWFRDYDPSIGRYIESDPIGLDGGINTYAYVAGNPVAGIDPRGLQVELVLPRPLIEPFSPPWAQIVPPRSPIDVAPVIPDTGSDTAAPNPNDPNDCCKGIRQQLKEHEQKLADYKANPAAHDNKGFLGKGRDAKVIAGRIKNLENQIENFRKQLEACERAPRA